MILDCLMMESISCRHYPESDELDIKKGNMHSHGAQLAKPINHCDSCNIVFFGVQ